jgi:hypothetical protein
MDDRRITGTAMMTVVMVASGAVVTMMMVVDAVAAHPLPSWT